MKKRFLRDKVFNEMIGDINEISDKISEQDSPAFVFHLSLIPLSKIFLACESILTRLEKLLEQLRKKGDSDEMVAELIEVIKTFQECLIASYDQVKQDFDKVIDDIRSLRDYLDQDEGENGE